MSSDLPLGWVETTLGSVATLGGGTTPSKAEPGYWENPSIPWATPTDITSLPSSESNISSTEAAVSERALRECSLPLNPPGTILMTSRATIGYAAINAVPMATNQGFITFRCNEKSDPHFLYQWLTANRRNLIAAAGGSTFKELGRGTAKLLPILLPPCDEQRRIAEVLRSMDIVVATATEAFRQSEKTSELLIKSAFDGGGERVRLGTICALIYRYPGFYGFEQKAEGVPVIRGEHLRNGKISSDWTNYYFVDPGFSARFPKTILQRDDVVMSVRGTVGTTAIVDDIHIGSQISPNLIRLVANSERLLPPLLYYAVQSAVAHMRATIVNAQALPAINAGDIKAVEIALPPHKKQHEILLRLQAATEACADARNALNRHSSARAAVADDLLSGRVRVPA